MDAGTNEGWQKLRTLCFFYIPLLDDLEHLLNNEALVAEVKQPVLVMCSACMALQELISTIEWRVDHLEYAYIFNDIELPHPPPPHASSLLLVSLCP